LICIIQIHFIIITYDNVYIFSTNLFQIIGMEAVRESHWDSTPLAVYDRKLLVDEVADTQVDRVGHRMEIEVVGQLEMEMEMEVEMEGHARPRWE